MLLRCFRAASAIALLSALVAGNALAQPARAAEQEAQLSEAALQNKLVTGMYARGQYDEAIPIATRILWTREQILGPDHPDVATSLNNLASLYERKGEFARAEPLYLRALRIREVILGANHPMVPVTLNNLAELYRNQGDFDRAEPLYERALRIRETALGPNHPDVALVLNNLGILYASKGDYPRAKALYDRALAARERALGPESPQVAETLNNMGMLAFAEGKYRQAQSTLARAATLLEKAYGPEHPKFGMGLNNLALSYESSGDVANAEPLFLRVLAIFEKSLGADHPNVGLCVGNLAMVYMAKGDNAKAEAYSRRALALQERALGRGHPEVATSVGNLALLYEVMGDNERALQHTGQQVALEEQLLSTMLASSAESQKRQFFQTLRTRTNGVLSFHLRAAPESQPAAVLALTTVLRRKGRVLDSSADTIAQLRTRANPEDQSTIQRLQSTRAEEASRTLEGPGDGESAAQHQSKLAALHEQSRSLEEALARRYASVRTARVPVTVEAVQHVLGAGQALVEITELEPFDTTSKTKAWPDRWEDPRYVAYVVAPTGPIRHVDLGPSAAIDALVKELRASLASPDPGYTAIARRLDALTMAKIRPLLGQQRDVFLSPDGALGLIPFAALVDDHDRFLVQTLRLTQLSSGRDLLRFQDTQPSREAPLVLAAPDYTSVGSAGGQRSHAQGGNRGARALDFAKVRFSPLPGTAAEAASLAHEMPGAKVLTGADATKEALSTVHGPKVLHVATHGFFLEGEVARGDAGRRALKLEAATGSATPVALAGDPLLRSGLALAGANRREAGSGTGILTALEASSLDLWGTKLVTLSACETGVGEVRSGDGIYGLRRALVLAGAETQMMSLWKVDDAATEILMAGYYRRLMHGGARSEALRQVQLEMLASPKTAHPYYWSAFFVSGDPRTLDGHEAPPVVDANGVGAADAMRVHGGRGCGCMTTTSEQGAVPAWWALGGIAFAVWRAHTSRIKRGGR